MTADEFCARVDEILIERERTLKEFQVFDLRLYKKIVQTTGVRPIDLYYLEIVGVPYHGPIKKVVPRVVTDYKKPKQGGLF